MENVLRLIKNVRQLTLAASFLKNLFEKARLPAYARLARNDWSTRLVNYYSSIPNFNLDHVSPL